MLISPTASEVVQLPRVPNSFIGRLLDHGKASAKALHLVAIKVHHFNFAGGALNEAHARKYYGVKRPSFRAGIRLLKQTGVLERGQSGRRTFARERLAEHGDGYVLVNPALLKEPASVVAFALAANLCPGPMTPETVARRFGVKAIGTARKLARAAIAGGYVAHATAARGKFLIARRGHVFDPVDLVKKVPTKNMPTKKMTSHKDTRDFTEHERDPLRERTRSHERGAHVVDLNEDTTKELGPEWIVLKDWRTSKFWRERAYMHFDASKIKIEEWSLEWWRWSLDYRGGCPPHLATPQSHRQGVEIAHELSAIIDVNDPGRALQALSFWICRAHAAGKPIRSLAFIAEELARRCDDGDDGWLYDLPYREPDAEVAQALKLANEAAPALEGADIQINRRILFSTIEIEAFVRMIRQHGRNAVVNGINHALRVGQKPAEGRSICGWAWFNECIATAMEAAKAKSAAEAAAAQAGRPAQFRQHPIDPDLARRLAGRQVRADEIEKAARAGAALLAERGFQADQRRLLYRSQLRDLSGRLQGIGTPAETLHSAILRWAETAPAGRKVRAWSNLGSAIREQCSAVEMAA